MLCEQPMDKDRCEVISIADIGRMSKDGHTQIARILGSRSKCSLIVSILSPNINLLGGPTDTNVGLEKKLTRALRNWAGVRNMIAGITSLMSLKPSLYVIVEAVFNCAIWKQAFAKRLLSRNGFNSSYIKCPPLGALPKEDPGHRAAQWRLASNVKGVDACR